MSNSIDLLRMSRIDHKHENEPVRPNQPLKFNNLTVHSPEKISTMEADRRNNKVYFSNN